MSLIPAEQIIKPLYFIKQEYRDNVIIDKSMIDGVKIRSIDDYLLNFPNSKKLVYEYMKKTPQPVELSYLHKLFGNQINNNWYRLKAIETDETAKRCVEKLIKDPYTWKYGQNAIHSTIFDSKYLLIKDKRLIAKECIDVYMTSQPTHYVSHKLSLRSFNTASTHNEYFIKRLELTRQFFENVILKDVELSNTLHVNYMYDCIEIYDEVTKMTFAYYMRPNMDNFMLMIYPHGQGTRKTYTQNPRSVISMMMRYPELYQLNKNVEAKQSKIIDYHNSLAELKREYADTYNQMVAAFEQILEDYKAQDNYLDVLRLGMIAVHNKAVESSWFSLSGPNDRIRLWKSTYFQKNNSSTENVEDWLRITQQPQTFKGRSLKETAEFLLDNGVMQIFYTPKEPALTEYLLLSQGKINHRHIMLFLMSSVESGLDLIKPYLDIQDSVKIEYEHRIETGEHEEHKSQSDPNINPDELYSRLEFEYKKKWPQQFEINRKQMIKNLLLASNQFLKKNKALLK